LDRWIHPLLPLILERANGGVVLELGCGFGIDTAQLCKAGLRVVATDLSADMLKIARQLVPQALFLRHDIRCALPISRCDVVIASLSLHYFDWTHTVGIIKQIGDVLRSGGVLICRVNSVNDVFFGAGRGVQLERHFYEANGRRKRFFDESDIAGLFGNWRQLSRRETTTFRYGLPKRVWEIVLERD
jgi:SAM-dependent methyltransferase